MPSRRHRETVRRRLGEALLPQKNEMEPHRARGQGSVESLVDMTVVGRYAHHACGGRLPEDTLTEVFLFYEKLRINTDRIYKNPIVVCPFGVIILTPTGNEIKSFFARRERAKHL